MKKYEINILGGGAEIVVGNLTQEQVDSINKVMADNDIESLEEFYNDSDMIEKADVSDYFETDDLHHIYGPLYGGCTLEVTDKESGDVVFNEIFEDLDIEDEDDSIVTNEIYLDVEDNPILFVESIDKGTPFSGIIETEEDFDIKEIGKMLKYSKNTRIHVDSKDAQVDIRVI